MDIIPHRPPLVILPLNPSGSSIISISASPRIWEEVEGGGGDGAGT